MGEGWGKVRARGRWPVGRRGRLERLRRDSYWMYCGTPFPCFIATYSLGIAVNTTLRLAVDCDEA